MIKISSYDNINGVAFGSNEARVIALFGQPIRKTKNREKEQELHFINFILRFDALTGDLRECTLLPQCDGMINGFPIAWDNSFLRWLASNDANLVEVLGFVLSLKLGVALSGFHDEDESQKAIHVFRKGDWDMFRNRMTPFKG